MTLHSGPCVRKGPVCSVRHCASRAPWRECESSAVSICFRTRGAPRLKRFYNNLTFLSFFLIKPVRSLVFFFRCIYNPCLSSSTVNNSFLFCPGGGIGRRAWFRSMCLRVWGFESPLGHHWFL